MAVFPNTECYFLCEWMLTVFVPRLTGTQQTLTALVQAAALAQTSVTDQEWKDFQNYAQWRNPYYIVYRDYQAVSTSNLSSGLVNYYKMEGNSTDSIGSLNGTDNAVTYNTAYGKILQGVTNNNSSSYIEIGTTSSFSFIQNTCNFGINFWWKPSILNGAYRVMGNCVADAQKGFAIRITANGTLQLDMYNGSGVAYNIATMLFSNTLYTLNYQMLTFTGDGSYVYAYINGVLIGKVKVGTLSSGNSQSNLRLLYVNTSAGSNTMYMDEVGFWNRGLTSAEVYQLYNSGAGLTYPF